MYCHVCATQIENGDSFCRSCGAESAAISLKDNKTNLFSTAGHFLLGAGLFAVVVFVTAQIIGIFFPWLASPQLLILISSVLGLLSAGLNSTLLLASRRTKIDRKGRRSPPEIADLRPPELLEKPYREIPFSVTDPTTHKLRRRR